MEHGFTDIFSNGLSEGRGGLSYFMDYYRLMLAKFQTPEIVFLRSLTKYQLKMAPLDFICMPDPHKLTLYIPMNFIFIVNIVNRDTR